MWRIVDDFWDNWPQLKKEFEVCNRWAPNIGDGHFPDADMLPLGHIGIRAERGDDRMCSLTKDEQILMMSLFAIFRSPLMFGGNLPDNDEFTLSLITNKAVLAVNQHSANNRQLFNTDDLVAWTADDPKTGDKYLALFNVSDQQQVVESKAIWKSELITQDTPGQSVDIDIDITGAKKLYLVAINEDENGFGSHNCDWVEPILTGKTGEIKLTDRKWVNATTGRGEPVINQVAGGGKLIVNGKEYKNGINTYANSVIEYTLPEGVTRFKAKAGIDKEALNHLGQFGSKASARFMVFTENPAGPVPPDKQEITIKLGQLNLTGSHAVKDLWSGEDLGKFADNFTRTINRHGAGLYRIQ